MPTLRLVTRVLGLPQQTCHSRALSTFTYAHPHKKVSGLSRSLQGDLRHRENVGQLLPWRLVIDRRFHRLIYLFGREEHGRLRTGRAG